MMSYSLKKSRLVLSFSLFSLLGLMACGEETTTENVSHEASPVDIYASVGELPKCSKKNNGEMAWVKNEVSARVCVDGKWFATVSSRDTVKKGDIACSSVELADASGIKILCNGDSIGTVPYGRNGENGQKGEPGENGADGINGTDGQKGDKGEDGDAGKKGTDGEDGTGCTIANQTDSSVTIRCGKDSLVLDLFNPLSADTLVLDSEVIAVSLDSLVGYSQKGPFLKGSMVYLYELTDGRTLKQTNGNFVSYITQDDGRYKFSSRDLVSQYALIVVDGFYRNEVSGKNSDKPIKLHAVSNLLSRRSANVNLLTHLEYDRVYRLVTQAGMSVRAAKRQAQSEILKMFHIDATGFKTESEDMNVFGKTDADAALLAVSVLLLGDRNERQLSELLSNISFDLESDSTWKDTLGKVQMADWALVADSSGRYATIHKNVVGWNLGNVPHFQKHLRKFWSIENGLGVCGSDSVPVGLAKNVTNKNSAFYASSYEDTTNTEIRFICVDADSAKWRVATDVEKNTFDKDCSAGKDGVVLFGRIDSLDYFICDKSSGFKWRYATDIEKNTYQQECSEVGTVIDGVVDKDHKYYCTSSGWIDYLAWSWDVPKVMRFNPDFAYDSIVDARDGKVYRTTKIGDQVWMAENLNYADSVTAPSLKGRSWCPDHIDSHCEIGGRLYTWSAAMDSAAVFSNNARLCGYNNRIAPTYPVRGICPENWHLPDTAEYKSLQRLANPSAFQSRTGWGSYGLDEYGFSALPIDRKVFWSSTMYNGIYAYVYWGNILPLKYDAYPIRCVKDN